MEGLRVCCLHKCKHLILECCNLINSEWPRSKSARLQSLFMSCERFPTSLVLLYNEEVVGHVKLTEITVGGPEIMIESVIIRKDHRGKGWGKLLMGDVEIYAKRKGKKCLYLSTRGQEGFYEKLGYVTCKPILYLGFALEPLSDEPNKVIKNPPKEPESVTCPNAPPPPPLPLNSSPKSVIFRDITTDKTYMCKSLE